MESTAAARPVTEKGVRQAFARFDKNNDGTISRNELASVLRALDSQAFSEDSTIDDMFSAADADRNGAIDYNEFVAWVFQDSTILGAAEVVESSSSSSDSEPDKPRPAEATTTEELYELLTMANGRVKGLLLLRPLVDAFERFEDTGLFDLANLVPQSCGDPESAKVVTVQEFSYLCKMLSEAKIVNQEELTRRLTAMRGLVPNDADVQVDVDAAIGFRKFRLLLRVLTNMMRVDRRHLCAHFAWLRTQRFEMTQATCDLFVNKCFLKSSGSRSRITANNFSRFCQAYGLVDDKERVGLSYGSLNLWFTKLVERMPQLLAAREKRRTKPRGKELRAATKRRRPGKRKASRKRGNDSDGSGDDGDKGNSICGIAQVSVMMEEFFGSLPGSVPLRICPLRFVLQLIKAEPIDRKRVYGGANHAMRSASKTKDIVVKSAGEAQRLAEARNVTTGFYRITQDGGAVVSEALDCGSSEVGTVDKGITFSMLEVVFVEEAGLVRARLEDPAGWVTIFNARNGERSADLLGVI